MNVEAVVLKLLLKSDTSELSLTRYNELKQEYFSPAYSSILVAIARFYESYHKMPTLWELKLDNNRTPVLVNGLSALENLEIPDEAEFDLAVEILKDQYTQKQFLTLVSKTLVDISAKNSQEIIELASSIPYELEKVVKATTYLHTPKDITILQSIEDAAEDVMYTGISNKFDSEYGATRRGELFLIGGRRGAGKSVICINIAKKSAQDEGLIVPYFSIEMSAVETMSRYVGICAGIDALKIRNQSYEIADLERLVEVRASMFSNGKEILEAAKPNLIEYQDYVDLDAKLAREGILDENKGNLIVIDDPSLKLSSLDMHLTTLKARYKEKLGTVVVDYVNQVVVDGVNEANMYDWKNQIVIAKGLKALARKHDVVIYAPYQIDENGEARMSKGILDSCDFAYIVEAIHSEDPTQGALRWKGTKARSLPAIDFASPINWATLTISSMDLSEDQINAISESRIDEDKPKSRKKDKSKEGTMPDMELQI